MGIEIVAEIVAKGDQDSRDNTSVITWQFLLVEFRGEGCRLRTKQETAHGDGKCDEPN
jgi:hypothetical protein